MGGKRDVGTICMRIHNPEEVAALLRAGKISEEQAGVLMSMSEEPDAQFRLHIEGRKMDDRALQKLLKKLHAEDQELLRSAASASRFVARARKGVSEKTLERIHRTAMREVLGGPKKK